MSNTPRIALATSAEVATLDDEGQLLAHELTRRGALVEPAVWDDSDVRWATYDRVVVRSTWDYPAHLGQFLAWAEHVAGVTRLANGPALLRWSTDKRYLRELARAGIPVVPSTFVTSADGSAHPLIGTEHVVKPSVSAGSRDTVRLGPEDADRSAAHVRAILDSGRTAMVQPYLADVDTAGESAVLFLEGAYSHAVRKAAILTRGAGLVEGLFAAEEITSLTPGEPELALARRVVAHVRAAGHRAPLYCRVDLLPTAEGPVVLEVELAEPSMFLTFAPGSAARFADAILLRAGETADP